MLALREYFWDEWPAGAQPHPPTTSPGATVVRVLTPTFPIQRERQRLAVELVELELEALAARLAVTGVVSAAIRLRPTPASLSLDPVVAAMHVIPADGPIALQPQATFVAMIIDADPAEAVVPSMADLMVLALLA